MEIFLCALFDTFVIGEISSYQSEVEQFRIGSRWTWDVKGSEAYVLR